MERKRADGAGGICAGEIDRRGVPAEDGQAPRVDELRSGQDQTGRWASMWQQLVARDFRFDSGRYFPREMVRLDLSSLNPQWQILAANDLRREAQKGHQSLKEKYGK